MHRFETQGIAIARGNFGCLLQTLWAIIYQNLKKIETGKRLLNFDIISTLYFIENLLAHI